MLFIPSQHAPLPTLNDPIADAVTAGEITHEEANAMYLATWNLRCDTHGELCSATWHGRPICLLCLEELSHGR